MIIEKINKLINEKGIKLTVISNRTGISGQNLNRILQSDDIKISHLEKIAKALEVPIGYFFEKISSDSTDTPNSSIEEKESSLKEKHRVLKNKYIKLLEEIKKLKDDYNDLQNRYDGWWDEQKSIFLLLSYTLDELSKIDLESYNIESINKNKFIAVVLRLFLWILLFIEMEEYKKASYGPYPFHEGLFTDRQVIEKFKNHYRWFIKYKDFLREWFFEEEQKHFTEELQDFIKIAYHKIDETIFEHLRLHSFGKNKKLKDY